MIRILDILAATIGLLILSPVFIVSGLAVALDSGFPVLYRQSRLGRNGKGFMLLKFRTMFRDAHKKGLITVGGRDPRVTRVGYILRKFKLDELPQLLNVLRGEMSLVGPRPEVQKYVDLYPEDYQYLLQVRPGITSPASLAFSNENEILATQTDPENYYRETILPEKIRLDKACVPQSNLRFYFSIVFQTIQKVVGGNKQ